MELRSVSGKFAPWQMTTKQKQHLLSAAFSYLKCAEADENFFKNTLTGDKTWVHSYYPKTKHLPAKMENTFITTHQQSRTSSMQDKDDGHQFFFIKKAIVQHDHDPYGQTVNKHFHLVILRYLYGAVCHKQPKNGSVLHGKKKYCNGLVN